MSYTDRSEIVRRMSEARDSMAKELTDISAEEANRGSSWAVVDLLRHLRGRPYYINLAERVIKGETVSPPRRPSPGEMWQRTVEQTLKDMDECIGWVEALQDEDLEKGFGEGAEGRTVKSLLETAATHYEEHLEQLRRDIKPAVRSGVKST